MAAKKKATSKRRKKSNPTRRRRSSPAKKPTRRRRRKKKNPTLHPVVAGLLGGAVGGGAGVGTSAALRYFNVGSPTTRGWGQIIGGVVIGLPVAFLSGAFGAGLTAGMVGAGGAELTAGIKPRNGKKKNGEKKNGNNVSRIHPVKHPRFGPRDAADVAASRAARRIPGRGDAGSVSAVVADDIGAVGAVVADDIAKLRGMGGGSGGRVRGLTTVEGLGTGVGMVIDSNGHMYIDESLANRMTRY